MKPKPRKSQALVIAGLQTSRAIPVIMERSGLEPVAKSQTPPDMGGMS